MRGAAVIRYDGARGTVWRIKYRDASGKQVMETVGAERDGVTEKMARAELRERLVRVERKGYRRPSPLTFAALSERWFVEEATRKGWRPRTVLQYRSILARLNADFGRTPVAALRPSDVSAYGARALDRGFAPSTVSRDLSILRSILGWAVWQELAERNAAQGVPHPRVRQRKGHALSPVQVQRLLPELTDRRMRAAFLVFVLTGLRRGELQALRWCDVSLVESVLRVRDSKSEAGVRSIALTPLLAEELWQLRRESVFQGDGEYVFAHPQRGSRLRYDDFRAALVEAFAAAGMNWPEKLRPCHDLRVTAITNDAIAGASPIAIMTKAGHTNMATTKRYLRLAGAVFRDEAAALERRLLGGSPSTQPSTHLSRPQPTSDHASASINPEPGPPDPAGEKQLF